MESGIYIGTSGWSYKAWAETFYPKALRPAEHLAYYAQHFPTVEINATFYRLPETRTIQTWHDKAPPNFLYAIKGSRSVTHYKRLKPGARSFALLLERIGALREHLGPVLWQLPGNFPKDVPRLAAFLKTLPRKFRHAMEFRHPSWLDQEIFHLLSDRGVALVSLSSNAMPMELTLTADFTYIRFHGLQGGAAHDYTEQELQPWADHLRDCAHKKISAFVYFNNDVNTRAPMNALALSKMAGVALSAV
ncbi:MAG: DUF72 domain-containing protein [Verrucomicrobia bacterium]|nr:DUF72 domain-containing protein [Verrucomicrobiota bacterium]